MNASNDPVVVECAVRECFKKKTPRTAARITSEKLGGGTNLFIGGGTEIVEINLDELESAVWERIKLACLRNLQSIKPGFEHVAIAGTLEQFGQKASPKNIVTLTALLSRSQ